MATIFINQHPIYKFQLLRTWKVSYTYPTIKVFTFQTMFLIHKEHATYNFYLLTATFCVAAKFCIYSTTRTSSCYGTGQLTARLTYLGARYSYIWIPSCATVNRYCRFRTWRMTRGPTSPKLKYRQTTTEIRPHVSWLQCYIDYSIKF